MRCDLRLEDAAKIPGSGAQGIPTGDRTPANSQHPLRHAPNSVLRKSSRWTGASSLAHDQLGYQYAFSGGCRAGCRFHRPLCRAIAPRATMHLQPRGRLHDQRALRRGARTIRQDRLEAPWRWRPCSTRRLWAPFAAKASHDHYYQDRYLEVGTDGRLHRGSRSTRSIRALRGASRNTRPKFRAWFGLLSAARIHLEQNRGGGAGARPSSR